MLLPQAKSCHRHTRCENKNMSEKKNLISGVISYMKHSVFKKKKKITRHKKKQESMVLSKEQNKSMQDVSEDAKISGY